MKRTFLSNEEIIDQWDAAINKNVALDRLAIACRTDRSGMKAKLRALGVTEDELETVPTAKPKRAPDKPDARKNGRIDPARARELYDAGKNDVEIAAELGTKHGTIYAWRKRNGLKTNAASAFQRKKKKEEKTVSKYKERETENAVIEAESASPLTGFEPVTPKKQGGFKLEPKAELSDVPEAPATPEEPTPLSLGELRRYLTELLPAVLNGARLYIDGAPVTEFYGFSVTSPNGVPTVDLLTRRG